MIQIARLGNAGSFRTKNFKSSVAIAKKKILVIKNPDFYDLVHRESKMGLRIMDNLAQVVSSRLKAFVDYY